MPRPSIIKVIARTLMALMCGTMISGCASRGGEAEQRYEIVKRSGAYGERCTAAREVAAAYLEDKNEWEYQHWTVIAAGDCAATEAYGSTPQAGDEAVEPDNMLAVAPAPPAKPANVKQPLGKLSAAPPRTTGAPSTATDGTGRRCVGTWAYVPKSLDAEVGFSIHVPPEGDVKVQFSDFGSWSGKPKPLGGTTVTRIEDRRDPTSFMFLDCEQSDTTTVAVLKGKSYMLKAINGNIFDAEKARGRVFDD